VLPPPEAPGAKGSRLPLYLALAAVPLLVVAGYLLTRKPPVAAPTELHIPVRSQPMGALVLVDGKDTGVVTNGEIVVPVPAPPQVVLTFRRAGSKDESRTVKLPLASGEAVSVSMLAASATLPVKSDPPGATVALDGQKQKAVTPLEVTFDPGEPHRLSLSLEGHTTQDVKLVPGQVPAEVAIKLEPAGPQGTVAITSEYPLDVTWRGRVLAKDQVSPKVSLPGGRQTLSLQSGAVFLKADVPVTVTGGAETALAAPGLGKLNIRALPDNCQIFLDGSFVDYPPILNKSVAAGSHVVSFSWPDGGKSQETVDVAPGGSAFVTGRKN
jgi:hypothetical protein